MLARHKTLGTFSLVTWRMDIHCGGNIVLRLVYKLIGNSSSTFFYFLFFRNSFNILSISAFACSSSSGVFA